MTEADSNGLEVGQDGAARCFWGVSDDDYRAYHDDEWGVPVSTSSGLFEKICLEGFQSGLSWLTILRKRENFRAAFDGFDYTKIAEYEDGDIERLMGDAGIVRHRGKIVSVINNARRACEMEADGTSLAEYLWRWEPTKDERPDLMDYKTLMSLSKTVASSAMSKELKRRGWSFIGPTTAYAFMQAVGMVNDHIEGCFTRDRVETLRSEFVRP